MTAQLPTPGSDAGTWGTMLNEFLGVSMNSNGTIMSSALTQAGGVLSTTTLSGGDLTGTIATPTVAKVNGVPLPVSAPSGSNEVLMTSSGGAATTWSSNVAQLSGATFTGYVAPAVAALTYNTSIAVNAALSNVFSVTLTGNNGVLANPTGGVDGQVIRFRITQGTGGNFTISYGTAYDFGAAGQPVLSTTANKVDVLSFEYNAALSKWCYFGAGLGF